MQKCLTFKVFPIFCFALLALTPYVTCGQETEESKMQEVHNSASLLTKVSTFGFESMNNLESTLLEIGVWGPILVFAIYLVTTLFMLPLWGFHMTCGWVYGTFWSSLLIATTQAICAGAALSMSRYVVGPYIRGFLTKRYGKKFDAIDKAVGKEGLKITLLLRLSPIIPFGMNNYVCGVTGIKLWEFVLGTWLGVLPGTTAYCNLGSLGKTALDKGTTPLQKCVMLLGVFAGLWVIKLLSNLATDALREAGIDDVENNVVRDNTSTTSLDKEKNN